jgi:hypothetical protein
MAAMAVVPMLVDDLNGAPDAETVPFAIDGTSYEIDLGEVNSARLRSFLAEFIAAARVVEKVPAYRARPKTEGAYGFDPVEVREWWRANAGRNNVPAFVQKGRIPTRVVEAWEAAVVEDYEAGRAM